MAENDAPMGPRGQTDFVGHVRIPANAVDPGVPINNLIANAKTSQGQWVERATSLIGPARAEFRSTYIRWALAINGLHVAADIVAKVDELMSLGDQLESQLVASRATAEKFTEALVAKLASST